MNYFPLLSRSWKRHFRRKKREERKKKGEEVTMRSLFTGKEKFPPSPDPVLTAACPSLLPRLCLFGFGPSVALRPRRRAYVLIFLSSISIVKSSLPISHSGDWKGEGEGWKRKEEEPPDADGPARNSPPKNVLKV